MAGAPHGVGRRGLAHSESVRHPLQSVAHMRQVFLGLFALTLLVFVGFQVLGPTNPGIVDLELAFTYDRTVALLAEWSEQDKLRLAFGMGFDYLFMPVYATTIGLACVWVTRVSRPGWRSAGAIMAWAVWVAALFDAVENVAMFTSLLGSPSSTTALVAGVCATVKFALLVAAIVFVVVALFAGRRRVAPTPTAATP